MINEITKISESKNLSAGINLLEAAIEFFETVEGDKYPAIVKILHGALLIAKMF